MKSANLYYLAERLSVDLRILSELIAMRHREGNHTRADEFRVTKQRIESKLRHLNHHIITSGA